MNLFVWLKANVLAKFCVISTFSFNPLKFVPDSFPLGSLQVGLGGFAYVWDSFLSSLIGINRYVTHLVHWWT